MLTGLTHIQVRERLANFGANSIASGNRQSAFQTFAQEFKSPLVLMLIGASAVSLISGSYTSAILIIAIIVISSIINFSVSYKSQKAAQTLTQKIALRNRVVREGKEEDIFATEIVPGDILILEAGNVVPADGVVKEGHDLFVNESSLTGESLPVAKNVGDPVYLGSGVITGHVYVEVTKTGKDTEFYTIVSLLQEQQRPSEFEQGIKEFSFLITKVVLVMAGFVFLVNALLKHEILESFIFALAIAVGITPELLPMIIALNVSKASIKMAHKGVIVKKLSAVENFGGMDILCTDKTGTLTEDKINVVKYLDIDGHDSLDVLRYAYITSTFHTGTKSPLDDAIAVYREFDTSPYTKIDENPFDFERRRDSMAIEYEKGRMLLVKGAPENIFPVTSLTPIQLEQAQKLFTSLSHEGYRILAVAMKQLTDTTTQRYTVADEVELTFAGFIAFMDPPKKGVQEVLDELQTRGITIKIITGDHLLVAQKIANDVALSIVGVLESHEIDALTDDALAIRAEKTTIFARVTPVQKNRIIKALQSRGHVVGYMGDGINDAPALRTADIGISVNNAVDVAKEAADIILLSKSFRQLIDGVVEGRRTFANTVKYITMAISSNFGNMFSMVGASLFLPFLPMLPVQVLLNNMLYEGSQFALTFDNVEDAILSRPNPWNMEFIKRFMVVFGTMSSIFDFLTFYILYRIFMLSGATFQTGWFIESFATQILVIFIIRTHVSIFKSVRPHYLVMFSALTAVVVAWGLALSPLGSLFGFVTLPILVVIPIIGIISLYLIFAEYLKRLFFRKFALAKINQTQIA